METFKLVGILIVLTLVVFYSFQLINQFISYYKIKSFATDIENILKIMKLLSISDGGWKVAYLKVPLNYTLSFDNQTNQIVVSGAEDLSINLEYNILYNLTLEPGTYKLEIYYGNLSYDELKSNMVVFIWTL